MCSSSEGRMSKKISKDSQRNTKVKGERLSRRIISVFLHEMKKGGTQPEPSLYASVYVWNMCAGVGAWCGGIHFQP